MKNLIALLFFALYSSICYADLYVGGMYGLANVAANNYQDKNVAPQGPSFGGFIGANSKFVGLEGFYNSFNLKSDIKHDGNEYILKDKASALGMALRFSFEMFYLRGGVASISIKESTNTAGQEAEEIKKIYGLFEDNRKSGVMFGGGLHWRMSRRSRLFLDYSRYQVSGYGDFNAVSVGLAFMIPVEVLSLPDKEF